MLLSTYRTGLTSAGNTASWASGQTCPNSVGPSRTPATISPRTRGCPTISARRPHTPAASRTTTSAGSTLRVSWRFGSSAAAAMWSSVGMGFLRSGEVAFAQPLPARVPHHVGAEDELDEAASHVLRAVAGAHPQQRGGAAPGRGLPRDEQARPPVGQGPGVRGGRGERVAAQDLRAATRRVRARAARPGRAGWRRRRTGCGSCPWPPGRPGTGPGRSGRGGRSRRGGTRGS